MKLLPVIMFAFFMAPPVSAQDSLTARQVYDQMMASVEKVRTMTFQINMEERIFDKMVIGRHRVKLQTKPFKTYIHCVKPDEDVEILYIEGKNNGKALVYPNRFPFINVNLYPTHVLLRKHHQYTVAQMGFGYLYNILRKYEEKEKESFFRKLKLDAKSLVRDKEYYILEIDNTTFGFMNYKVMKGETITSIANKFHVNDQMIMDLNRNISYFDEVQAGQVISMPNSYARRIVFYVDKKNGLPLTQIIYDNKGLFSRITFTNFVLNPLLKPEEFTSDYPGYKF